MRLDNQLHRIFASIVIHNIKSLLSYGLTFIGGVLDQAEFLYQLVPLCTTQSRDQMAALI